MSTLFCFYDEGKNNDWMNRMDRLPDNMDFVRLNNLKSLDRAVEAKAYRLILLVTYGFSIPSIWQTSRAAVTCPIVVMTGMHHLDGAALIEMAEKLGIGQSAEEASSNGDLFRTSLAFIEENIYDHELSLDKVASHIYVSRCHYSRMFQRHTGKGFKEYVIDKRLKKANALLRQGYSVTEVCFNVGYSDLTHFARVFKRKYGINPSNCRSNEELYLREEVLA